MKTAFIPMVLVLLALGAVGVTMQLTADLQKELAAREAAERELLGWRLGYEIRLDRKLQTYIDSDETPFGSIP